MKFSSPLLRKSESYILIKLQGKQSSEMHELYLFLAMLFEAEVYKQMLWP